MNVIARIGMLAAVTVSSTIGANTKRLRVRAGFDKQTAAAKALGWTEQRLADVENDRYGAISLPRLIHMATTFKCLVEEFFVEVDPKYDEVRQHWFARNRASDDADSAALARVLEDRHLRESDDHAKAAAAAARLEEIRNEINDVVKRLIELASDPKVPTANLGRQTSDARGTTTGSTPRTRRDRRSSSA